MQVCIRSHVIEELHETLQNILRARLRQNVARDSRMNGHGKTRQDCETG